MTYEDRVDAVALDIAKLKLTGTDRWFLAKDIGDIAYEYKVPVSTVKEDVLTQVDVLVDALAD